MLFLLELVNYIVCDPGVNPCGVLYPVPLDPRSGVFWVGVRVGLLVPQGLPLPIPSWDMGQQHSPLMSLKRFLPFNCSRSQYTLQYQLSGHDDAILCLAVSNSGKTLASGGIPPFYCMKRILILVRMQWTETVGPTKEGSAM